MTLPETISADYTLRPSELAKVLALLVEARQPTMVWGPPGAAKSMIARQVAAAASRQYVDVRALLLDPVDLRGIPWRDSADRTRWAPPVFLPPSDDPGLWLINLEELPSAVPMVQAALYQLFLERKCGEYELPEGASLIACGNRDADRAVVHRMPTPLSNRLVHLEIRIDARDWCAWGAANGIAPEVLFFIELEPELLHRLEPQSREHAFPSPRSWEFASNIVKHRNGLDPATERALFRGTVGEAAAVQFTAFLKVWRELPHPRAVINDPENADIPDNASTLMALCGSLYRMASDVTLGLILSIAVHPADVQDRDGALLVLNRHTRRLFPFLETIFADGAYGGAKLRKAMADATWRIELVKRSAQAKGFEVIPRRWVVERTIAWINRCRRLAKDYENLNRTAIAFIRLASIRLMLRRLTRYCYPS